MWSFDLKYCDLIGMQIFLLQKKFGVTGDQSHPLMRKVLHTLRDMSDLLLHQICSAMIYLHSNQIARMCSFSLILSLITKSYLSVKELTIIAKLRRAQIYKFGVLCAAISYLAILASKPRHNHSLTSQNLSRHLVLHKNTYKPLLDWNLW